MLTWNLSTFVQEFIFETSGKHFKSPIPQSIVIGLEEFFRNDIQYCRGLIDTAEMIWQDFKEQALDLICDIEMWANPDNFKEGIIDQDNPFSGKSPGTDGLIDDEWYLLGEQQIFHGEYTKILFWSSFYIMFSSHGLF